VFESGSKGTDTWIIDNEITETDEVAIQLNTQIEPRIIGNTIQASGGQGIKMYNCVNNIPFTDLLLII